MACAHSCVMQCVAVCGSVWQCAAVCYSVSLCVAVCFGIVCGSVCCRNVCCSVLQCVAVCCSVVQCVAVCCSLLLTHSRYGVATTSRLLKIIGLFCERALKRDYILQKRPLILRSLRIVATP